MLISQNNDNIKKYKKFYKIISKNYSSTTIILDRKKLLNESFSIIMAFDEKQLKNIKLIINFKNENGSDYGGLTKDFFYESTRKLFSPFHGLFQYASSDSFLIQISPLSQFIEDNLLWFQFAGRLLGLALKSQCYLDFHFISPFYKYLLKKPIELADLELIDPEYHKHLSWIGKEKNIDFDKLQIYFSVDEEIAGKVIHYDLINNGKNIMLKNSNKNLYIKKMVTRRIMMGLEKQYEIIRKGFYEVINKKHLNKLTPTDLEWMLTGLALIDIKDWQLNTKYCGYNKNENQIIWFWEIVEEMDENERLLLLKFSTGSSGVPLEGFSGLRAGGEIREFCIEKVHIDTDSLPLSHTCFNRLDLPRYESKQKMKNKLLLAINECSTFENH